MIAAPVQSPHARRQGLARQLIDDGAAWARASAYFA
jgi:hypothetical protein